MKKIADRFWVGVIAGLGGNIAKMAVENFFVKRKFSTETGAKKAAGIFLKKRDINKPLGKVVGYVGDNMIAAGLGIACVYWLTLMGKDKWLAKGAGLGAAEWTGLYGVMSKMGATSIFPTKPPDAIVGFLSHLVFGATKMAIVVKLGDERLFSPGNPKRKIEEPQNFALFDANLDKPMERKVEENPSSSYGDL